MPPSQKSAQHAESTCTRSRAAGRTFSRSSSHPTSAMGSASRRLERLEEASQDRARAEVRRAWASLTDEEVAELLSPYADWTPNIEPSPEGRELEKRMRAAMPDELISRAIGQTEHMSEEEVDRRLSDLVRSFGISERGDGIRRHMLASGEEGAR